MAKHEELEPLMTCSAVAKAAGVGRETIRRMADAGKIPYSRPTGGHRRYLLSQVHAALTKPVTDAEERCYRMAREARKIEAEMAAAERRKRKS
tara:strand:+ start:186 stop:464 length:279 start_codon:yes stop_codon:yes gene_type:complete